MPAWQAGLRDNRKVCTPAADQGVPTSMFELLTDLWEFLRERKKFWLLPIIVVLVMLGGLLVFAQGSAVAPFIYTLF